MTTATAVPPSAEVLHEELLRIKEDPRATNAAKVNAFEAWFKQACAEDRPPDALRRYIADEAARFASYTIPGPDGHCYWGGPKVFATNNGSARRPIRWVWEQHNGPIHNFIEVYSTCGEQNCIAHTHLTTRNRRTDRNPTHSEHEIIGAARQFFRDHGHSPSIHDWTEAKLRPTRNVIAPMFGGWAKFLEAAGLPPSRKGGDRKIYGPEDVENLKAGIQLFAQHLGRRPTRADWNNNRQWLVDHSLPTSYATIKKHVGSGSWIVAMKRAGV